MGRGGGREDRAGEHKEGEGIQHACGVGEAREAGCAASEATEPDEEVAREAGDEAAQGTCNVKHESAEEP